MLQKNREAKISAATRDAIWFHNLLRAEDWLGEWKQGESVMLGQVEKMGMVILLSGGGLLNGDESCKRLLERELRGAQECHTCFTTIPKSTIPYQGTMHHHTNP